MSKIYIFVITILVLALGYFSFFDEKVYKVPEHLETNTNSDTVTPNNSETQTVTETNENLFDTNTQPVLWVPKQEEIPSDTEVVLCPDDVYICSGGGFGTPNYDVELKRVPPTCEFPACPG